MTIATDVTTFRGYKLFYENESATQSMMRAIDEFPSFFTPRDDEPLIIDCGANIGVSVLEWKTRWPMSRVICFEPDPDAFRLLNMNIEINDVPGVQCINAAITDYDGVCLLHGETGKGADARGNSIHADWGLRQGTTSREVPCRKLSPFLSDRRVTFLKIDIEGAEERVLSEISSRLERVEAIYVEVHETDDLVSVNDAGRITRLLLDSGFTLESESRYQPHSLPPHLDAWQRKVNAKQSQLLGWR